MSENSRVVVTIPTNMKNKVICLAGKRGQTISGFVRVAMAEELRKSGVDSDPTVLWGGNRHAED